MDKLFKVFFPQKKRVCVLEKSEKVRRVLPAKNMEIFFGILSHARIYCIQEGVRKKR